MKILFTICLLIIRLFLIQTQHRTFSAFKNCPKHCNNLYFNVAAKGKMLCNGKPYTNGGIEYVSFWRYWSLEWKNIGQSLIKNDGTFYVEGSFFAACDLMFPDVYFYVHSNCNKWKSYYWDRWFMTEQYYTFDWETKNVRDFGTIELSKYH